MIGRVRDQLGRVIDREVQHRLAALGLRGGELRRELLPGGRRVDQRSRGRLRRRVIVLRSRSPPASSRRRIATAGGLGSARRRRRLALELAHRLLDRRSRGGHVRRASAPRDWPGSGPGRPGRRGRRGTASPRLTRSTGSSMSEVTYFLRMPVSCVAVGERSSPPAAPGAPRAGTPAGAPSDQVVVVVAVADVLERVVAAHPLVAGRDVDLGVLVDRRQPDVRVVVVVVDVDVDAADRVDRVGEAREVDVDDVVDVVEAGELLDDLQGQLRPAVAVGGVELVDPVAGDVHLQVARDRQDRDLVGGDAQQDRRVRPRADLLALRAACPSPG